jgi:predicted amidohydrolase YtcJ
VLIRNADVLQRGRADVRIGNGVVLEIGLDLRELPGEDVIEAAGGALLPGLHDHHLHLRSLAAALSSVPCGPPQVRDAGELARRLHKAAAETAHAGDWIRGIGYHESVAGDIDRHWLDRHLAERPVRIQHRSGRLWILNSRALAFIDAHDGAGDDPLERIEGRLTGRLYDADGWLRERLGGVRQNLRAVSRWLAGFGITGVTDTTPGNTRDDFNYFQAAHRRGELLQDILVMGDASLDALPDGVAGGVTRGPHKFHLHDAALPELGDICARIQASHRARRPVAFHCVTRAELVFTLVALRESGSIDGDRIEHAAITPPDILEQVAELGLTVVTQPNFIAERGDSYLQDVEDTDQPWLYRLRGFLDAGIPLAGSTDAPFGDANPWKAMQAAVSRRTPAGAAVGAGEALAPEEALELFLSPLATPGRHARSVGRGEPADLCLLDRPWAEACRDLADVGLRFTLKAGAPAWPAATESPE